MNTTPQHLDSGPTPEASRPLPIRIHEPEADSPTDRSAPASDSRTAARRRISSLAASGAVLAAAIGVPALAGVVPGVIVILLAATPAVTVLAILIAGLGRSRSGPARPDVVGEPALRFDDPRDRVVEVVPAGRPGVDGLVVVAAGQFIPADGEVVAGAATVDESAVTGESSPVFREAGGGRSSVLAGTRVLTNRIVVRISAPPSLA